MANFYVTHNKYPDNPQFFTTNIVQVVKIEGEPDTDYFRDHRGEHYWEITITTTGTDSEGNSLDTSWIDVFESEVSIDEAVADKIREICEAIDWSSSGDFDDGEDNYPPYVFSQYPLSGASGVPIDSTVRIVLKENLPSDGIDIDTLVLKIKDIQVIPTITGNPYEYTLTYSPTKLL